MNIELRGRSALITGSTAGIGFAIAKGMAESGAAVVVNGRADVTVDRAVARDPRGGSPVRLLLLTSRSPWMFHGVFLDVSWGVNVKTCRFQRSAKRIESGVANSTPPATRRLVRSTPVGKEKP
jgi:NAD(P)-dependent dehydrogenase (short-subunit alcohol dehydrogenase family)